MSAAGEPCFEVVTSGLQTTVQDLGRPGLLATGMPPSGAFDAQSLRLANLVVGNDPGGRYLVTDNPGAAGLEMLFVGPELRVLREAIVAVTGADLSASVNGQEIPPYDAVRVTNDDVLTFPRVRAGARGYLAVAGGIDVPVVLGARSTNLRARIGGIDGRKLDAGDTIAVGTPTRPLADLEGRRIAPEVIPATDAPWEVRVVLGPQDHLFTEESVERFLTTEWKLSATSDRMGCRFIGPPLEFKPRPDYVVAQAGSDPSNIVDDTIPVGGIQVPSGVEPIVLAVDGPSLGGYAKIATVVSTDLSRVAQMRPGDAVRFTAVTVAAGVDIARRADATIAEASVSQQQGAQA